MFGVTFEWDPTDEAALRRRLSDRRTRMGQMCTVAADPVGAFGQEYGRRIVQRAEIRAPKDTGRMARGVRFRWENAGGAVYSTATYGGFVDQGTRPHWPPPQALAGWAARHGIPAFLVGRKIAEEGTEATHWITHAVRDAEQSLPSLLRDTATRVEMSWNVGV
jgi:hypothetical protein